VELSRVAGRLCGINCHGFEDVNEGATVEVERLKKLVKTISENWEWSWKESAEDDKRRALAILAPPGTMEPATQRIPLVTISENHHIPPAKPPRNFSILLFSITALALGYVSPFLNVVKSYHFYKQLKLT
jgi:hypothetical protein